MRRRRWFDDFFKEFEEIEKMFEKMFEEALTSKPGEPLFYGFSINIGPGGEPEIKTFGNIKSTPTGELIKGAREPFAEVMIDKDKNELIITAEMPGVSKEDIKISATEDSVTVRAETAQRKYYKEFPLEVKIDPNTAKANYNNGVLEIKVKLKEAPKERGVNIKVE
ncbi:MAG: Hsp20/alpha crystallin family protein [Candidatus Hydrothermarchaeota archaeon]|nr:MAG: Hsp20/alpha crystallin family protein [Candidatus Hydrothermarchaeota archaeon]